MPTLFGLHNYSKIILTSSTFFLFSSSRGTILETMTVLLSHFRELARFKMPRVLFVTGAVVTSITVVIDIFIVYLAVDVTTVHIVFFATAIVIVVTVAVALITIDTISLVPITVIFFIVFAPTNKIDVVCHTVINVVIVDFLVSFIFADVFVVVFICCGLPQFRWC